MKSAALQKKLIAAARAIPVNDTVPYAFEKRVMACIASQIRSQTAMDVWTFWARTLWRAAAPCVAIMLFLGVWAFLGTDYISQTETLSADLEGTVMAPFNTFGDSW